MKKDKPKYLNFPISLLQGFMDDNIFVLDNIMAYCVTYEIEKHGRPFEEVMENYSSSWDKASCLDRGRQLFNNTPMNQPRTGLEVRMFWEYHQENKTDEEKATLLAFLATKSIVGVVGWYKLGKQEIIFHRMAGHTDCNSELPDTIKPFCTRFKFDKIKKALMLHWGISIYSSHTRGMYIGTIPLQELALIAERRKLKAKQKEATLKAQQEAVRNQALMKLGIQPKTNT